MDDGHEAAWGSDDQAGVSDPPVPAPMASHLFDRVSIVADALTAELST